MTDSDNGLSPDNTKLIPGPMFIYCYLDHQEQTPEMRESKYSDIRFKKTHLDDIVGANELIQSSATQWPF